MSTQVAHQSLLTGDMLIPYGIGMSSSIFKEDKMELEQNKTEYEIKQIDSRVDDYIAQGILEQIKELEPYNYSKKKIQDLINAYIEVIEKYVKLINSKDLLCDIETSEVLYALLANPNSNNTRHIFSLLTGIHLSSTAKASKLALAEYFGGCYEEYLQRQKEEEVISKQVALEKEKQLQHEQYLQYFSHKVWDKEEISKLTPLQKGKLIQVLDKLWNFQNEGVVSMKTHVENNATSKFATNNMHKWNRRKFNSMSGHEQEEYEEKLIKGRTYNINREDGYTTEIAKIVHDVLLLKDETNHDSLNQ